MRSWHSPKVESEISIPVTLGRPVRDTLQSRGHAATTPRALCATFLRNSYSCPKTSLRRISSSFFFFSDILFTGLTRVRSIFAARYINHLTGRVSDWTSYKGIAKYRVYISRCGRNFFASWFTVSYNNRCWPFSADNLRQSEFFLYRLAIWENEKRFG